MAVNHYIFIQYIWDRNVVIYNWMVVGFLKDKAVLWNFILVTAQVVLVFKRFLH